MYTLLKQQRLHWLGHAVRMADGRIQKDLLYGELVQCDWVHLLLGAAPDSPSCPL